MKFRLFLGFVALSAFAVRGAGAVPPSSDPLRAQLSAGTTSLQNWSTRYATAAATVDEGTSIARTRLEVLRAVAVADPEAVIAQAVTPEQYAALPAAVRALTEMPISAVGDFNVLCALPPAGSDAPAQLRKTVVIGGRQYPAIVYGRRAALQTKYGIPLQGVLLDGSFILDERSVVEVAPSTLSPVVAAAIINAPGVKGAGVVGRSGGKLYRFASREKLLEADAAIQLAEQAASPIPTRTFDQIIAAPAIAAAQTAAATSWAAGLKKVLIIRVDFPDLPGDPMTYDLEGKKVSVTKDYAQQLMETQVLPFYADASDGQISYAVTVTDKVYRISKKAADCAVDDDSGTIRSQARDLVAADYPGTYDRYLYVFSSLSELPGSKATYWSGLGSMPGSDLWINGDFSLRVVGHELGHNCGAGHANGWEVTDGNPISASGTHKEYADPFDIMGSSGSGRGSMIFNPFFKNLFGWIAPAQIKPVTTAGTYRLYMFDTPGRSSSDLLALTYKKDSHHTYMVSYRGAFTSVYSSTPAMNITRGGYILWNSADSTTATEVLDMAPETISPNDAALLPGAMFTDMEAGLAIKAVGVGGQGRDKYLDVEVSFFEAAKMPIVAIGEAKLGVSVPITTRTTTPPARTQLFIDGQLWQESVQPNPTFAWEPTTLGAHTVVVTSIYADGSKVSRSASVTVSPSENWTWVMPLPHGLTTTSIAYTFGKWWASAAGGTMEWSTDFKTWSVTPFPTRTTIKSLATDGTRLLATCDTYENASGKTVSSFWATADGTTWTDITAKTGLSSVNYIRFINGTWLALGSGRVSTSTNGQDWTTPVTVGTNYTYQYAAYGNGHWLIAGSYGTGLMTSTDLKTWTQTGGKFPGGQNCSGIAYANGTWGALFLDQDYKTQFYSSKDGQTWTSAPCPDWSMQFVTDLDGQFVMGSWSDLYSSNEGTSWTKRVNLSSASIWGITKREGVIYAAGSDNKFYTGTSLEGLAATDHQLRPDIRAVAPAPDGSLVFANQGYSPTSPNYGTISPILHLKDGVWRQNSLSGHIYAMVLRNNLYVAVGSSGKVFTSTDANTWTARATNTISQLNAVVATSSGFVAVGESGTIITSPDGMTWTTRTSGTTASLSSVASDGKTTLAVGGANGGILLASTDWQVWNAKNDPALRYPTAVVWHPGIGFAIVDTQNVWVSADGSTWQQVKLNGSFSSAISTSSGLVVGGYNTIAVTTDGVNFATAVAPLNIGHLMTANGVLYASNGVGLAALATQPPPPIPLRITAQPAAVTAPEGLPASFAVACDGSGPVSFQWYRAGAAISGATDSVLTLPAVTKSDAAAYSVAARNPAGVVTSVAATLTVTDSPIHIVAAPAAQTPALGTAAVLCVTATADGSLTYQWYRNGQPLVGATSGTLDLGSITCDKYGAYSVKLTSPTTSLTTVPVSIAPPATIVHSASSLTLLAGATYAFTVLNPVSDVTYQWVRNGTPVAGATGPTLVGTTGTVGSVASIAVQASINGVTTVSEPLSITTAQPVNVGHLTNVSVLTLSGAGDEALTVGFVSNAAMAVLVRASGPALIPFNVTGTMANPWLGLYKGTDLVSVNDDWGGGSGLADTFSRVGAFGWEAGSRDAAIQATVAGLYSARCTGLPQGAVGKALVEVYDTNTGVFSTATPRLINLSCRALVGPGDRTVTVGFVIGGNTARTVLIRASGPALKAYGLSGALNDPKLTLYAGETEIGGNDSWGGVVPTALFAATGAFALPDVTSKDAAVVLTLSPGLYTVRIAPTDASTGIALAEVYEVE